MAKKPSYPRREAPQPLKNETGLTSDEDGAQRDRATEKGLQGKMQNDPRKCVEALDISRANLNSRDDHVIHLGDSPP